MYVLCYFTSMFDVHIYCINKLLWKYYLLKKKIKERNKKIPNNKTILDIFVFQSIMQSIWSDEQFISIFFLKQCSS